MNSILPFAVGDTIRRVSGTSATTYPGFVGVVRSLKPFLSASVDITFECGATGCYWFDRPRGWEVVNTDAPTNEPGPAENGVYAVAMINPKTDKPMLEGASLYKYWVDAERAAETCSRIAPGNTFGVLKLVGTVSMKPTWAV